MKDEDKDEELDELFSSGAITPDMMKGGMLQEEAFTDGGIENGIAWDGVKKTKEEKKREKEKPLPPGAK